MPLVEIVPHPETDPSVTEKTYALMKKVGQSPVKLNREIEGFVLNRLQYAVISEAWRLVGVCTYFFQFLHTLIFEETGGIVYLNFLSLCLFLTCTLCAQKLKLAHKLRTVRSDVGNK